MKWLLTNVNIFFNEVSHGKHKCWMWQKVRPWHTKNIITLYYIIISTTVKSGFVYITSTCPCTNTTTSRSYLIKLVFFPDCNFTMNWCKMTCTNVDIDKTECHVQESHLYHTFFRKKHQHELHWIERALPPPRNDRIR